MTAADHAWLCVCVRLEAQDRWSWEWNARMLAFMTRLDALVAGLTELSDPTTRDHWEWIDNLAFASGDKR